MNFLGMGPGELVLVLIIAVIVLGPGKLPEVARALGKTVRDFRAITDGFQNELRQELNAASASVKDDVKPLKDVATTISSVKTLDPVSSIASSVKEEVKPLQEVADTISSVQNPGSASPVSSGDTVGNAAVELPEEAAVSVQEPDDSFTAHYQDAQGSIGSAAHSVSQSDDAQVSDDSSTDDSGQDDHPVAFNRPVSDAGEEEPAG